MKKLKVKGRLEIYVKGYAKPFIIYLPDNKKHGHVEHLTFEGAK